MSARSVHVILLLAAVAVAGCVNPAAPAAAPAASLLDAAHVAPTGIVHEWDLHVTEQGTLEVGGRHPFTMTFADGQGVPSLPGPELRVRQGDTVRVRLHTEGPVMHTIHWHGVRLPWGMDGVPDMTQDVGRGVFTYEFVANDAGTFWYHCHVAAPAHIDFGMFGALIVEPADPAEDPPFDREYTLMLHEMDTRSFALVDGAPVIGSGRADTLTNAPANPLDAPEHARENAANAVDLAGAVAGGASGLGHPAPRGYHPRYDLFMINGKTFPDTEAVEINSGETIRLRLINAGQLAHAMHLHGHRFLVTHKDGALLSAPYLADTIGLFPGERYDIYVRGDNPGHWDFHDHGGAWGVGAYAANDGLFPGGMTTSLVYADWQMPDLEGPTTAVHRHAAAGTAAVSSGPATEAVRGAPPQGRWTDLPVLTSLGLMLP